MKRERATQLLEELLTRVVTGGEWLDLVDEVWVFGSFARGALEPGDIDLAIEYTADDKAVDAFARALATGRDWHTELKQALRGRRRGFQLTFNSVSRLAETLGFEPVLLYRRGDSLDTALGRLAAIKPDPEAGRAEREAMLPAFEGVDKHLPLPIRKALVELHDRGVVAIERVKVEDGEPRAERARRVIGMRYRDERSAARRALCAAAAQLEREGIDLGAVSIGDRSLGGRFAADHMISWTIVRLNTLPSWIRDDADGHWLHVVNPSRSKPLVALRFRVLDAERLPENQWRLVG